MSPTGGPRRLRLEIGLDWSHSALPTAERSFVELHLDESQLVITIDAPFAGDPSPPPPARHLHGLWDYEVVEVFLASPEAPGRYLELEFSPHGHFLVLLFEAPRVRSTRVPPEPHFEASIDGERWSGRARLDLDATEIDLGGTTVLANAFRLAGKPRRYELASPLPGASPDFHQPSDFPALAWQ